MRDLLLQQTSLRVGDLRKWRYSLLHGFQHLRLSFTLNEFQRNKEPSIFWGFFKQDLLLFPEILPCLFLFSLFIFLAIRIHTFSDFRSFSLPFPKHILGPLSEETILLLLHKLTSQLFSQSLSHEKEKRNQSVAVDSKLFLSTCCFCYEGTYVHEYNLKLC